MNTRFLKSNFAAEAARAAGFACEPFSRRRFVNGEEWPSTQGWRCYATGRQLEDLGLMSSSTDCQYLGMRY